MSYTVTPYGSEGCVTRNEVPWEFLSLNCKSLHTPVYILFRTKVRDDKREDTRTRRLVHLVVREWIFYLFTSDETSKQDT